MFTDTEKQVLINLIAQSRFTPSEWEQVLKPIMIKLQEKELQAKEEKKA